MNDQQRKQVAELAELYAKTSSGPWGEMNGSLYEGNGLLLSPLFDQEVDAKFCAAAKNTFPILISDNLRLVGLLQDKEVELFEKDGVELDVKNRNKALVQSNRDLQERNAALRQRLRELGEPAWEDTRPIGGL